MDSPLVGTPKTEGEGNGRQSLLTLTDDATVAQRNISVHHNWLARLFRVKPFTSHLCLTISRKRARQEVTLVLREWRKYGVRDIQVDRQRNIIFARVAARNCESCSIPSPTAHTTNDETIEREREC